MRRINFFLVALLVVGTAVVFAEGPVEPAKTSDFKTEDRIVILTDKNIKKAINQFDNLLVYFYAPWCGMCQEFSPIYKRMAQGDQVVTFAKINADTNELSSAIYRIDSYPTMKLFVKGKQYNFDGVPDEESLQKFIRKILVSPIELSDGTLLAQKLKDADKLVVFVPDGKLDEKVIFEAARQSQFVDFIQVSSEEARSVVKGEPSGLYILKQNGKQAIPFTGKDRSQKSIIAWIADHKFDLVVQGAHLDSIERIFKPKGKPAMIGIFDDLSSPEYKAFEDFAESQGLSGGLLFFVSRLGSQEDRLADFAGINYNNGVVIVKGNQQYEVERYILTKPVTVRNLDEFYQDYREGRVAKYYRSEPVPEAQNSVVKTVVGSTFRDFVPENSGRAVVMYFWDEGNYDCTQVTPIYESLANTFAATSSNVVFTKLQWSKNDIYGISINETPKIGIFMPGSRDLKLYKGNLLKKDGLESFIRKNLAAVLEQDPRVDL